MDRRRRQYVALDALYAFSDTTDELHRTFGAAGPLYFIYLIAAAKRAHQQGTITYVTDTDFWSQLGVDNPDDWIDVDAFLALLGRMKQVRRTSKRWRNRRPADGPHAAHTRPTDVTLTNFEKWQKLPRTYSDAERKRRYRAKTNGSDTADVTADNTADDTAPIGVQRRDETNLLVVGSSTVSEAAQTAPASTGVPADAYADASRYILDNNRYALPQGDLAVQLIERWPQLDDIEVQQLLREAGELEREMSAP